MQARGGVLTRHIPCSRFQYRLNMTWSSRFRFPRWISPVSGPRIYPLVPKFLTGTIFSEDPQSLISFWSDLFIRRWSRWIYLPARHIRGIGHHPSWGGNRDDIQRAYTWYSKISSRHTIFHILSCEMHKLTTTWNWSFLPQLQWILPNFRILFPTPFLVYLRFERRRKRWLAHQSSAQTRTWLNTCQRKSIRSWIPLVDYISDSFVFLYMLFHLPSILPFLRDIAIYVQIEFYYSVSVSEL